MHSFIWSEWGERRVWQVRFGYGRGCEVVEEERREGVG